MERRKLYVSGWLGWPVNEQSLRSFSIARTQHTLQWMWITCTFDEILLLSYEHSLIFRSISDCCFRYDSSKNSLSHYVVWSFMLGMYSVLVFNLFLCCHFLPWMQLTKTLQQNVWFPNNISCRVWLRIHSQLFSTIDLFPFFICLFKACRLLTSTGTTTWRYARLKQHPSISLNLWVNGWFMSS